MQQIQTFEADGARHGWNDQQQAIFEDVARGRGHTVVMARAGTGKTTTVVGAFPYVPRGCKTLMVAFNKKIAEELKGRAPRGVDVSTCHSFGLRALTKKLGRIPIDPDKTYKAFRAMYARSAVFPSAQCRVVMKLVGLAKGSLLSTADELDACIDDFSLLDLDDEQVKRPDVITDTLEMLERTKQDLASLDFDDMIWLPHVLAINPPTYDRIFIDETQDLNRAQIELALKACTKFDGRICAVGDDKQAIYRFRGADHNAIQNIVERLDAKVLPLSVTYRCPRKVVEVARRFVPDFTAGPENPEGIVRSADEHEMSRDCGAGDFVLSRTNAPLIGGALKLLKEGRRAIVLGRDIGTNLSGIVKRAKTDDVREMERSLDEWQKNESDRLMAKQPPQEAAAQLVADKADCIRALCEGCRTCQEVLTRIENLFSDARDHNSVVFSTVHKAKGLEANRVWMLRGTFREGMNQEESNIYYVAATRAKRELVMVQKPKDEAA